MNKKQEHCLLLKFNAGLDLEQCFMALFCTVEIFRLNGCTFYLKETGQGNDLILVIKRKERLDEICDVINGTPDMFSKLREKNIKPTLKQKGKLTELGLVVAGKLRGSGIKPAKKGLVLADLNKMYAREVKFKPQECPKCGKDVYWQAYCPHPKCRKQYMKLSKNGKIYTAIGFLFYFLLLFSVLTSSTWGIFDALILRTQGELFFQTAFTAFGIAGLIYIVKYRMKGFWLYIILRVFELITHLFAFFAEVNLQNLISVIVCVLWFSLAFIMLEKDLDYMF